MDCDLQKWSHKTFNRLLGRIRTKFHLKTSFQIFDPTANMFVDDIDDLRGCYLGFEHEYRFAPSLEVKLNVINTVTTSLPRIDIMSMSLQEKVGVVVSYLLRTTLWNGDGNLYPNDLIDLVVAYYWIMPFEWDPHKIPGSISLSNHNKRFTRTKGGYRFSSLCSKNRIGCFKESDMSAVRWELTIKQKDSKNAKNRKSKSSKKNRKESMNQFQFTMGYVDADYLHKWHGGNGEVNLYVTDGGYPMIDTTRSAMGSLHCIHQRWRFKIQQGDRFRLDFNFRKSKCTAFYNDELLVVVSKDLPRSVFPVASVFQQCSFETTLFDFY